MQQNAISLTPTTSGWGGPSGSEVRRKLSAQIDSVIQKGLPHRLRQSLVFEHGLPDEVAPAIADACLSIIWQRTGDRAPNQIWLNAPEGVGPGSRRYATRRLCRVLLTPVDEDDLYVWYESGLGAMQRSRLLRTLEQAERQGGQFQLRELAALHNLTVNATKERLRPMRESGVRLAYHGRSHAQRQRERIGRLWFAVEQYLEGVSPTELCAPCGLSSRRLGEVVAWWARACALRNQGIPVPEVAAKEGLSLVEVDEAAQLGSRFPKAWKEYASPSSLAGSGWPQRGHGMEGGPAALERALSEELYRRHGWSARRISALTNELRGVKDIYDVDREPDEILYEAASEGEPLGRPLRDCAVDTVRIRLATPAEGVGGNRPARITDVKRNKLRRYAKAAADQHAFLTNADLCYLLGVHTDVVSRLLREPEAQDIPTRQRAWERRVAWLARTVRVAEEALRGIAVQDTCDRSGLEKEETVNDLQLLVRVARDIEAGRASTEIMRDRDAPRWLIDRLTQHSSLSLLARLGRNGHSATLL